MSPVKIGFVGLSRQGWASIAIVPNILKLSDKYTLTALSTTSANSATESAKTYSELTGHEVLPFYGDTAKIAADPNVDMVAIAVKTPYHRETTLPAIAAGKDVFIEWPAGSSLQQCAEIASAAATKGVRTLVGLQGRQSNTILKIKELVDTGAIGKVLSSSVATVPRDLGFWGPSISTKNSYITKRENGATMADIAIGHFLGGFHLALGTFRSISATTAIQYPTATLTDSGETIAVTAEDHVAFTGILKSGAVSSMTWRGGYKVSPGRKTFTWEIEGEDGCIRVEGAQGPAGALIHIGAPVLYLNGEVVDVAEVADVGDDIYAANVSKLWTEFAKGSDGHYPTIDDAVDVHRVLDAIERSARDGNTVHLV
ncbi:hypothetical protein PLICRDRAFT_109205 [Plicaturopsis crispa FD-325 SS-3]|nr:hypothetical protein PLICRDRAFT_109205 [Plicaturopsis crispa FD-325 SS-3]